jgi:hypothetical protein
MLNIAKIILQKLDGKDTNGNSNFDAIFFAFTLTKNRAKMRHCFACCMQIAK